MLPADAASLALAASIYPPALAAVIAIGRGADVRLRVVLFVAGAYLTTFLVGSLVLFLFGNLGANSGQVISPGAALYILGGVALLALAARLRHGRAHATARDQNQAGKEKPPSRVDRYLQSRWLVAVCGVILYVVPSPIVIGALKVISDTNASNATQVAYLVQTVLIMLWIIELPMLLLIAFPRGGVATLQRINAWFIRHGRALLVLLCAAVGLYLLIVGVAELAS